jgi:conjugal transfer/type IV secretion protein DotA/TraY
MPIVVWVRLIAAYLLTCIEAVVAAPLAIIMMVTPEGEGISGTRLERAIQLVAAIVLKPTLLVIGLVAALVLSFVTFQILNFFFWRVSEKVTSAGIFELIAMMVIYTTTAFSIAKASIMIMHKVPDQILEWMAGGVGGRSFGDDAESNIQSGMGQVSSNLGGAAKDLKGAIGSSKDTR